jgi:phosphoribosylglycinamide formyltransferase-1
MSRKQSIGILVGPKGRGTNLRSIVEATKAPDFPACVDVVISPLESIPATEFARNQNIRVNVIPPGDGYATRLLESLENCGLVCLAGYTRLLPQEVLEAHSGRVLNIHPALLPKYGGVGMFGMHVHRAVLANDESESGCTVHFVTPVYDEGEIVLQMKCRVLAGDSAEDLSLRVLELEKWAYPEAIKKVINGKDS